jgi:hypothetical protein
MHNPSDQAVDVPALDPHDYNKRRGAASRSAYIEQVLVAATESLLPHVPDVR